MPTAIILWATLADDVVAIDADGLTDPVYMPRESAEIMVHWINERLASDYTVNQMIDLKDDIEENGRRIDELESELSQKEDEIAKLQGELAQCTKH